MDPNHWSSYNQHYGRIAHNTVNRYDLLEQGLSSGLGTLSPTLSAAHAALPTARPLGVGTLPPMSYGHPLHNMSQFLDSVNPLQPSFTGPSPYKAVPVSQAGYSLEALTASRVSHEPPASLASRYAVPPAAISSHGGRPMFASDLHHSALVKEVSYAPSLSSQTHPSVTGATTTSRGWGLSNFVPTNSSPFSNMPEGVGYSLSPYGSSPPRTLPPSPPTNSSRSSTIQRNPYQPEHIYSSIHNESRPTPPPPSQSPYHAAPSKPTPPPPTHLTYHAASSRPTPPPSTHSPYHAVSSNPVNRMAEELSTRSHLDNLARMQPNSASLQQSRRAEDLSHVAQPEDLTRMPPLAHIHRSHRESENRSHVSRHQEEVPISRHRQQQDYLGHVGRMHEDHYLEQSGVLANLSPDMLANSPQDLHVGGRNHQHSPLPTTISQTRPKSNAPLMSQSYSSSPISPETRQNPVQPQNVYDPYSHSRVNTSNSGGGYSMAPSIMSNTAQYPPASQITTADMNYDPVSPATPTGMSDTQQNDNFSTISLQDLHSISSHHEQMLIGNEGPTNTRIDPPELSPHIVMASKPPKEKSKSKRRSKGSHKTSQGSNMANTANVHHQDSGMYSSSGGPMQQNQAFNPGTSPMHQAPQQKLHSPMRQAQQFKQDVPSPMHQAQQFKQDVPSPMRQAHQFKQDVPSPMQQAQQFKQDVPSPMRQVQQFKQDVPSPMHQAQQFTQDDPSPMHQAQQFKQDVPSPMHQAQQFTQDEPSPMHQAQQFKQEVSKAMQQVGRFSQSTSSPLSQFSQGTPSPIHPAGQFSQGTPSPMQQSPIDVGSPVVPGSAMIACPQNATTGTPPAPSAVQALPAIQAVADSTTIPKPKRGRGRKKKQAAILKAQAESMLSDKPFPYQESQSDNEFPHRIMDDTPWMQKTLAQINVPQEFKPEMGMLDRKVMGSSPEFKPDIGMPELKSNMGLLDRKEMCEPQELVHNQGVPLNSAYEASVPMHDTGHLNMGPYMGNMVENRLEHKNIIENSDSEYFSPPPALPLQHLEEPPQLMSETDNVHGEERENSVDEKVFLSNTFGNSFGEDSAEPCPEAELAPDDNVSDQLIDAALGPESSDLELPNNVHKTKEEPESMPKAVTSELEFDEDFQHLTTPPKEKPAVPVCAPPPKVKPAVPVKRKRVKQKPPVAAMPVKEPKSPPQTKVEVKPSTDTKPLIDTKPSGGSSAFLNSFLSFIQGKKGETLSSVTHTPVKRPPMPKYVPEPRRPRVVRTESPSADLSDDSKDNSQNMPGTVENESSDVKGEADGGTKSERIWTSLGRTMRGRSKGRSKGSRSAGVKGKGRRSTSKADFDDDDSPHMSTDDDAAAHGEGGVEQPVVEEEIPTPVRRSARARTVSKSTTVEKKSKKRKHDEDGEDSEEDISQPEEGEAGEATYTSTEEEVDYDSDKDPAWTPFAAEKKGTTLETLPTRFRSTSGGKGRGIVGRSRGKGRRRSSAYISPGEESSRDSLYQEDSSEHVPADTPELNPIQMPVVNEGQGMYQKGTYLIEKRDMTNYENYPIWRVSEGKMLQKFELIINKGKVHHKSTFTYSSWTPLMYHQFEAIRVRMVMREKNREVVEVVDEDRPKPPTDGSLERQYEDDPMVENFNVYLQILLSQALEPGFLKAIQKSNDDFYMIPLRKVDEMVQDKIEQIEKTANWIKDFKEAVKNRPHLRELDRPNLKQSCQACLHVTQPAIKSVHLFGDLYDRHDLSDIQKDGIATSQEFMVGKTATQYLSTYHSLLHYKYNLYKRCIAKVNIVRESQGTDENSEVLDQCLHNRAWVLKLFEDLKQLLDDQ